MSRCDNILNQNKTIVCSNLGFGEQGAILKEMPKSIFVCPDLTKAREMQLQLNALKRENVLIDDFSRPFTLAKFQSNESRIDMLKAMFSFAESDPIIISTPEILFCPIIDVDRFKQNILTFEKGKDYDIKEIEQNLVFMGYTKTETVAMPGEFSRRGDVLDIFNVTDKNPTRLDFFDTSLENIDTFDFVTFEKTEPKRNVKIVPNRMTFFEDNLELESKIKDFQNQDNVFFEIASLLSKNEDFPLEFVLPFSKNVKLFSQLDLPIIISNEIQFETIFSKIHENLINKIDIFENEKLEKIFKNSAFCLNLHDFYIKNQKNLIFFDNYNLFETDLKTKYAWKEISDVDFKTVNFNSFLFNIDELKTELEPYSDKQIYLCLGSIETMNAIKNIFVEKNINFSTNKNAFGIILTDLEIPFNICFKDEVKFYIGSTNFAHKKEFKLEKKTAVKYLPKPGEYVVHNIHGVGKCLGIVTVNVGGVDKEFFKIAYRGDDILYVPSENADCLSLYLANGEGVHLNKLGGKEFTLQKLKAVKSIEDMSKELLELYAKRKATKGVVYPEDDYLYTEFENAFEFSETADQLQAIQDIKNDMQQGKVMDRLICGDVGFGKTEVAMRALFKAVEAGKQVAILAPTTILSLQHCMSTSKRTKDFGVTVEMLNRFKSSKEQKQILEDLRSGKINVICGTHRLLSKDVVFNDLGLLILDEEQRFGVKAKEQIKQMKNNVDVLSLSATPIPRTLSMTLMNIRDISIINTPPTNRLPVKTYVMGYNEEIVANAINEEINRDGQVLVVSNNIETLPALANRLKQLVNNDKAKFDTAHGQMSEIALENAIKRLYDKETNVFVSTTLIENGVDLPSANTLIVVDSDKLGLSQMYQLRGRVGRSNAQAYAYFTYNKQKVLSEDSTSRLQAIAENTELGSGFKIAMRDLQIRGAGELLGKVQHGHMIKIGYDMYSKLLNETLRRLKGEKVETEREIKIDIAITSKIPTTFIEDETERLKIIAKISNITNKTDVRNVLNELMVQYGKLPREIYQLTNVALIKALASKQKVKIITITKSKIMITYYEDVDLKQLMKKVTRFSNFKFENTSLPTISLNPSYFSVQTAMSYIIEFLSCESS